MLENGEKRRKCTCRFLWSNELHALNQFITAKTWQWRLFWATLISISLILAIFTTYNMITIYIERQSTTLITKNRVKQLQFPSIVVCPKNPDALNIKGLILDIRRKIPHLSSIEAANLVSFAIAGSGFGNMKNILKFASLHNQRLNAYLNRWKGKKSYKDFYNDLFSKFGYNCEDLFHSCYVGTVKIDCCQRFRAQYVILRGRCFRLNDHYQKDPNVAGKLMIYIKQLHSMLVEKSGVQPQTVVHISDNYTDVSPSPRFYINSAEKIHVRLWLSEIEMLPGNNDCSTDLKDQGRGTCFVNKYHTTRMLSTLNCSLFFLSHRYPEFKVCDPLEIVYNYNTIGNMELNSFGEKCPSACKRQSIKLKDLKTGIKTNVKNQNFFVFQASFGDLEYDTYKEVYITTLPGFISELGGQSGLFLGCSLISVFNIFVSLITYCFKRIRERVY